jgi:hypothetical protein
MAGFDDLINTLKDAAASLVTLEITTAVGAVSWDTKTKQYVTAEGAKVMRTALNVVDGRKVTQVDPALLAPEMKAVCEYHRQAESEGHDLLLKNVAAAKALFDLAMHYKQNG